MSSLDEWGCAIDQVSDDLGFAMGFHAEGQGLASEAGRACLDLAFGLTWDRYGFRIRLAGQPALFSAADPVGGAPGGDYRVQRESLSALPVRPADGRLRAFR